MRSLWCLLATVPFCGGPRMTPQQRALLKATVEVSASALGASATDDKLAAIARDLTAADPATHATGLAECALLQERAKILGREGAAILPLLTAADREIGKLTSDLGGAVFCEPPAPFNPTTLGPRLRRDAEAIEKLLQESP